MAGYDFTLKDRLKTSFNVLFGRENPETTLVKVKYADANDFLPGMAYTGYNQSVLSPLINRMAIDVSSMNIRHVNLTKRGGMFKSVRHSGLDDCINLRANIDQTGSAFIMDIALTLLSSGSCAIVPIETMGEDPRFSRSYDILTMRVGEIMDWGTTHVEVSLYDEKVGFRRVVPIPKQYAAIVYNPLYNVMNAPNSTISRLTDRLALMDVADARSASPGIDLILQLPYAIKTEQRKKEALDRIESIEDQLASAQYGVAYIGATEKITPLNRKVDNVMREQVEYLTNLLYSQLGLSAGVFDGSASQEEMLLYYNRAVLPITNSIADSMRATFLTRTAISQGQDIRVFYDVFGMSPIEEIANSADKFTRNEIMSSNEVRSKLGLPAVEDQAANELRNKNLNRDSASTENPPVTPDSAGEEV